MSAKQLTGRWLQAENNVGEVRALGSVASIRTLDNGAKLMKLKTEMNTRKVEEQVIAAAKHLLGEHENLSAAFEHGHWWVVCGACGAQWSAEDQEGGNEVFGIGFEEVSAGDESCL